MSFTVYPAIDVRDGRVVRLHQGDYARETAYADDPFALAMRYADAGADWLHLVDLDAARSGGYTLLPLLRRIAADGRLRVQTGGGVRAEGDVHALLDAGAMRVVVGSLAVAHPQRVAGWLQAFGNEALTLGFDVRRDAADAWRPALHGWTQTSDITLDGLLGRYADAGLQHVLCTDIERDGTLAGPNLDLYRWLRDAAPWLQVQASGGARDLADVQAARDAGCAGIVLGKALLEGRLQLSDALQPAATC
jgi:phosphoribosylformimino-5-aminoimidazole carboxamide ribotide isomerase